MYAEDQMTGSCPTQEKKWQIPGRSAFAIVLVACKPSSTVYLSSMSVDEFYLKVRIEPLDEGGFLATSPDLPGLVAQDVARRLIESYLEHGDPLPPAVRQAIKNSRRISTVAIPVGLSLQPA